MKVILTLTLAEPHGLMDSIALSTFADYLSRYGFGLIALAEDGTSLYDGQSVGVHYDTSQFKPSLVLTIDERPSTSCALSPSEMELNTAAREMLKNGGTYSTNSSTNEFNEFKPTDGVCTSPGACYQAGVCAHEVGVPSSIANPIWPPQGYGVVLTPYCWYCKKYGHMEVDCTEKNRDKWCSTCGWQRDHDGKDCKIPKEFESKEQWETFKERAIKHADLIGLHDDCDRY